MPEADSDLDAREPATAIDHLTRELRKAEAENLEKRFYVPPFLAAEYKARLQKLERALREIAQTAGDLIEGADDTAWVIKRAKAIREYALADLEAGNG